MVVSRPQDWRHKVFVNGCGHCIRYCSPLTTAANEERLICKTRIVKGFYSSNCNYHRTLKRLSCEPTLWIYFFYFRKHATSVRPRISRHFTLVIFAFILWCGWRVHWYIRAYMAGVEQSSLRSFNPDSRQIALQNPDHKSAIAFHEYNCHERI